MSEANSGNVGGNTINTLEQLRLLQAVTGDPAVNSLVEQCKQTIRDELQAQGTDVQATGLQYANDLQSIMEDAVLTAMTARHELRHDAETNHPIALQLAGRLALSQAMEKIVFIDSFAAELPEESTAVLRELPWPRLSDIALKNTVSPAPAVPELPAGASSIEAGEVADDAADSEPDTEPETEDSNIAAATPLTEQSSTDTTEDEEAQAEPAEVAEEPVQDETTPLPDEEIVDRTELPKPEIESSVDTNEYTAISALDLLTKGMADPTYFQQMTVGIAGKTVEMVPGIKYTLAVFKANQSEWIQTNQYNATSALEFLRDSAGHKSKLQVIFSNAIVSLINRFKRSDAPITIKHNGKLARQSRHMLVDTQDLIKFYVPHDYQRSTAESAETQSDTTEAIAYDPVETEAADEISPVHTFGQAVEELFDTDVAKLVEFIVNSPTGMHRSELEEFTETGQMQMLETGLKELKSRGLATISLGEQSGRISIQINE